MKISHGRTYQNGEGSLIRIRKEKWDHSFVGIAEENGTFMGYYTESGTSYDNPCAKSQLIDEIACPKCGDWKRECGCNNMTEPTNSAEEAVRKAINRAIAEKDAEITRLTKLNQENYGDSEWYAREAESLRQQFEERRR